ncbi:MAG: UvrB/UvrC motif-containing protein [Clostridia bacterium]|nr:UvrB/UvrC motif-containing protein [Clostridia bacterium]
MKCQSCGKKEATVRYYENINGLKQEVHFCIDCANKVGLANVIDIFSPMFLPISEYHLDDGVACKTCGYTLADYSATGLLGCPDCYETFGSSLDDVFYKIHGKNRHIKMPDKLSKKSLSKEEAKNKEIKELKNKIKELIEEEKYEEAAKVRDEIKKLER